MKHLLLLFCLVSSLHAQTVNIQTLRFSDNLRVGASSAVNSLTNGLIAYWTFDEMGSGNIYPNSVSGGYGLISNGASYQVTGIIGNAWGNSTADGKLYTNATTGLTGTNSSLAFWLVYTNTDVNYVLAGNEKVVQVQISPTVNQLRVLSWTNATGYDTLSFLNIVGPIRSNWTHYCITLETGKCYTLWTNGVQNGTVTTVGARTNEAINFYVGSRQFSGFSGIKIDDLRDYNRVLSSNEIWALSRTNLVYYGQ